MTINEFVESLSRDNLYDLIEAVERKFDAKLIKFDRLDIESHLSILSGGEKVSLTNDEWQEFTSSWSWRHLEDWILHDDQTQWEEELSQFIPKENKQ